MRLGERGGRPPEINKRPAPNFISGFLQFAKQFNSASAFRTRKHQARAIFHVQTRRRLIYHGDDLCNNPGVMKLVTQTAICY